MAHMRRDLHDAIVDGDDDLQAAADTLYGPDLPTPFHPRRIPIHAFGITGDMIPVLTHLGVDTYDSSSYIKSASVLDYYDPTTWSPLDFRGLRSLPCACRACAGITPKQLLMLHTTKCIMHRKAPGRQRERRVAIRPGA